MMRQLLYSLCLVYTATLAAGCGTLFGVNLTFVGERTALEQQVLGTYASLGTDLTSYSSVRAVKADGSVAPPPEITNSQQAVLAAMANRRYNRDDVRMLLGAGVVGEARTGLLEVLDIDLVDAIPPSVMTRELALQVIDEENRDRTVIIDRLVETTPGVTPDQREEVAWIFAGLNQQETGRSAMVQDRMGNWSLQ